MFAGQWEFSAGGPSPFSRPRRLEVSPSLYSRGCCHQITWCEQSKLLKPISRMEHIITLEDGRSTKHRTKRILWYTLNGTHSVSPQSHNSKTKRNTSKYLNDSIYLNYNDPFVISVCLQINSKRKENTRRKASMTEMWSTKLQKSLYVRKKAIGIAASFH